MRHHGEHNLRAGLEATAAGLAYRWPGDQGRILEVRIDFAGAAARRRRNRGAQLLCRAVRRGCPDCLVVDAGAGLGRDGFVLAAHGCQVHMVERHPVLVALLADALERAAREEGATARAAGRITLVPGLAEEHLERLRAAGRPPDVVYLDPMFPDSGKKALPGKEAALLRHLCPAGGREADQEALFAAALAAARRRVVVKRPRRAPPLCGMRPSYSLEGGRIRYDVHGADGR